MKHLCLFLLICSVALSTNAQTRRIQGVVLGYGDMKHQPTTSEPSVVPMAPEEWMSKFDASGYWMIMDQQNRNKSITIRDWIDVFVKLDGNVDLSDIGYVERSRAGDISVGRIPRSLIRTLASDARVRYVEASRMSYRSNTSGNLDTGVNRVHAGENLPQAIKGAGVVVGVLDSGIDFTHADFSNSNGTAPIST